MTLLDDHQAHYKLRGVRLVSQLLEVAPPELLRRTGLDTLIQNVSCSDGSLLRLQLTVSYAVSQDMFNVPTQSRNT